MSEAAVCCVCQRALEPDDVRTLGGRTFCAAHYQRVANDHRPHALPIVYAVGAVVLFAGLFTLISAVVNVPRTGVGLLLLSLLMALTPAVIWLYAFYQEDRIEPEPKRYVLGVAALAALLAQAIGQPAIRGLFRVQDWTHESPLIGLLGSIFIVGFVQEFAKYAAVRYTIFYSEEFDERADGILYGAAAGLGYATLLNVSYVLENNGVHLGTGAVQVSVNALAHASFGGVMGYFLSRAKFESMGPIWLPLGLILVSVLDGAVTFALRELPLLGGLGYRPWYGLVLAAAVAGVTFYVLFAISERLNRAITAELKGATAPAAAI